MFEPYTETETITTHYKCEKCKKLKKKIKVLKSQIKALQALVPRPSCSTCKHSDVEICGECKNQSNWEPKE